MALIERHPDVDDYIIEISLADIAARGGVADLVERGHIVILADYRLDFDFAALEALSKSTAGLDDRVLQRRLKKLSAPEFFEGPRLSKWRRQGSMEPLRRTILETLCRGDVGLFNRAADALRHSHQEALRIFQAAFPSYDSYRLVPTVRLTRTLFENLHWDDHRIEEDFHQARVFANLDTRPRIWQLSHRLPEMLKLIYREHDLGRFAGKDPNELLYYINGELLGGTRELWRDTLPKHRIAFEPGEVWLGESRLVSHQIFYGEAALVYMWFVRSQSMADPDNRFNVRIEQLHEEMRASSDDRRAGGQGSSAASSHSTSISSVESLR